MSREPDWEHAAQFYTHMTDLRENIMAMVSAWCEAADDDDLRRLHEYLRMGEEA